MAHGALVLGDPNMGGIIEVNKGYRGNPLPRLAEGEGTDVFPGSPLAVIGLFVFALRARFGDTEWAPLPWMWDDELRSDIYTEDGPIKLYIESTYNVSNPERNYRPAIYVGRGGGTVTIDKISVDNLVGVHLPTGLTAHHCYATMPVTFECEAETSGESSTIAETAWAYVLSSRGILRRSFGFHEVTEPALGDTAPSKKDKETWVTPVQFRVQYDMRWGVTPIAPRLRDMAVQLSNGVGGNEFFRSIAERKITEE